MNLFDYDLQNYKFNKGKKISLTEFFAGYGSQALSLKYLGINFEHNKISEWAIKSIQAYKDVHFKDNNIDYAKELSDEEILNWLDMRISQNYNDPLPKDKIKKYNFRKIYNNMKNSNNLGSICGIKGNDLKVNDRENKTVIWTYSYPCQDLSLAGKRKGMAKGSGTRSALLWEVDRIIHEIDKEQLPNVLLMENVPQVLSKDNLNEFIEWQDKLEKLGYKNYYKLLNAKDYGIPQNRNRCFMISILGDYRYEFPKIKELKFRLKDMLEDNVDKKYYLSEKMINGMKNTDFESYKLENKLVDKNGIASTIIARFEGTPQCITIPEATKKGYAEAYDGDGVYINRPQQKRGVVQSKMIQTLKTMPDVGVVVKVANYSKSNHNASSIVDSEGIAPTVMENHGTVTATISNLRIRKLTERECFRLMGVKDGDFENIKLNQSKSSLYHLAGDSIVVNVLMSIFKEMI